MSLPKISYPSITITVPSTKKPHKFRPFLVKEEKLLLMAKESDNASDTLGAIEQVVNNCSVDNNFDVTKIAIFDLEYIFLKLRAHSIDNICKVSYKDAEDDKVYDFSIDLNKVEVEFPKNVNNIIKINDRLGIVMKHPPASLYEDKDFLGLQKDHLFELIVRCIDRVYEDDAVYENYTNSELTEFIETLSSKTFKSMQEFLLNTPTIKYTIKYKNSLGHDRTIDLTSLNDFFTLR